MNKRPPMDKQNNDSLTTQFEKKVANMFNNQTEQSTKSQVLIHVGNILLIFVAVFCTFGALTSAFSIEVNTTTLVFFWLFCAIAVSIISVRYRVKGLLLLFIPVLVIILLDRRAIIDGGMWIIYTITTEYSEWLPVSVVFTEFAAFANEATAFISALGVIITFILGFTICLRRSVFITVMITAPIVFLTFVVTILRSDIIYLLGLIAVYLALLIGSIISPDNFIKRAQIAIPSFIIAIVIMTLAYAITPHGNHTREENIVALGNRFRAVASQMYRIGEFFNFSPPAGFDTGWFGIFGGIWQFNTDNVSIADAGSRHMTGRSLLEITVDAPGTFYIRGYSMQYFDGRSWINNSSALRGAVSMVDEAGNNHSALFSELDERARSRPAYIAELYAILYPSRAPQIVEMEINRTGDLTPSITFQPYFTADFLRDSDILHNVERFFYIPGSVHAMARAVEAESNSTDFGVSWHYSERVIRMGLYTRDGQPLDRDDAISATIIEQIFVHDNYLHVDSDTARELRRMALQAGINPNAAHVDIADDVARFIRSSGRYTLTPGPIPQDVNFTLYFLQSLQEGYCIHFATAAVLMLRALDVPARFVSGYAVRVSPPEVGTVVTVTDRNAHAWVEVYYDDIGWLYLEVTPSAGNTYIPPPRPHSPENVTPTPQPTPTPTPPPVEHEPPPNGAHYTNDTTTNAGATSDNQGSFMPQWLIDMMIVALLIIISIIFLISRRTFMSRYRTIRFTDKDTNASVLYAWRYINKLSRREAIVPVDIEELALKARFSQHRITETERTHVVRYARRLAFEIYSGKDQFGRMWLGYIRALA